MRIIIFVFKFGNLNSVQLVISCSKMASQWLLKTPAKWEHPSLLHEEQEHFLLKPPLFRPSKNIFSQPLQKRQDVTQGQFLSRVLLVWIQFSFSTGYLTKAKVSSLPYYLPIIGERKQMDSCFSLGH